MALGGALKDISATELVQPPFARRAKLPAENINTVVMGNVVQAGNKTNPARQAAINGDAPVDVQFSR